MPRLVRVVPAAPVPPAVPAAHRAPHQIARPAGIKFIENNPGGCIYLADSGRASPSLSFR
jgi:hypothetical protein